MKTTKKYVVIFAKDEHQVEVKNRFMVSLSKPLTKEMALAFASIDGVDHFGPHGRYTFEISICRAFDVDEVYAAVTKELDKAMSDIIRPTLVT